MRSIYEKKTQKILESQGYTVDYKIRPTRVPIGYRVDYFGLFDLIAYRPGDPIRWIAIKGLTGGYSELRKRIKPFFLPEGNQKELWRYTKGIRQVPKIEIYYD